MNLQSMASSVEHPEVPHDENMEALDPAALFAKAKTTTGLTWGYLGGNLMVDGVITLIASGTVVLTASNTNYVEATRAGVVSKNTTGFTAGSIPLYTVVTGGSSISSYTDMRTPWSPAGSGKLVKAMADANVTLTAAEARNDILETTGSNTALRDLIVPLMAKVWVVFSNTTTNGTRVIGTSGTGITVAVGKRAIVYSDGTNVVRVTADT